MLFKKSFLLFVSCLFNLTMCKTDLQKYNWSGLGHDWECLDPYVRVFNNRQFITNEQLEKDMAPEGYIEINSEKIYFSVSSGSPGEHTVFLYEFSLDYTASSQNLLLIANVDFVIGDEHMQWLVTCDDNYGFVGKTFVFNKAECFISSIS